MSVFETNVRLLTPGIRLYLDTRLLRLHPATDDPELLQKIATRISYKLGAPCVPKDQHLVVAQNRPVPSDTVELDDFAANIEEFGQRRLCFNNQEDQGLMATLVERRLYSSIAARTKWWRFGTFHTFFDPQPESVITDIAAYRSYSVSAVILDRVGIGIAVDVNTSFISSRSVADYLSSGDSALRRRFERLSSRQVGHKGTLLYDLGSSKHKCYFDQDCPGMTCATTGPMRIKGVSYSSLHDYLTQARGMNTARPDDPVTRVSFPGLDRPQFVPSKRLFVRVSNDELPSQMKEIDKLTPNQRRNAVNEFWDSVGLDALVPGLPPISGSFWRPPSTSVVAIAPPALEFKNGTVPAPIDRTHQSYRQWFRDRAVTLGRAKAFYVPPTAPRTIHFTAPTSCSQDAVQAFADALCGQLSQWTGFRFAPSICSQYRSLEEGIANLERSAGSGMAVFVFEDDDPAAYFEIEYGLKSWRVKRLRVATLLRHFDAAKTHLKSPAQNGDGNGRGAFPKQVWRWNNFVKVCALDVFQKLGALPWRVEPTSPIEAELSIDVGADRRHFSVSLLVNRDVAGKAEFSLETLTEWKADYKHEAINPEALKPSVIQVFRSAPISTPLQTIAVYRDGNESSQERNALEEAFAMLKVEGRLHTNARVIYLSVRKSGIKNIRLWELDSNRSAVNTLEGTAVRIRPGAVILCTTGGACLTQGSADPLLLASNEGSTSDLDDAVVHFFHSAQLNYSSPTVAQRLSAGLKRTDEELRSRAAQEIRRIK